MYMMIHTKVIDWTQVTGFDWDDGNSRKSEEKHDSNEFLDWKKAKLAAFPNLKPSTKTISLRLPEGLLDRI